MPTKCNKPHKCLRRRFCAEFLCGLFHINFVDMVYLDELENIQLVSDTRTYSHRCSPVRRHENIRQEHPLRNSKLLFNSFPVPGEGRKNRGATVREGFAAAPFFFLSFHFADIATGVVMVCDDIINFIFIHRWHVAGNCILCCAACISISKCFLTIHIR